MESAEDGGGVRGWFAQGLTGACRTTSVSDVGTRSMPGLSANNIAKRRKTKHERQGNRPTFEKNKRIVNIGFGRFIVVIISKSMFTKHVFRV